MYKGLRINNMDFQDVLRFYSVNELVDDGFVEIDSFAEIISIAINTYQNEEIFQEDVSFKGAEMILKMMSKEQLDKMNLINHEALIEDYHKKISD
jgi:hypothetical protein